MSSKDFFTYSNNNVVPSAALIHCVWLKPAILVHKRREKRCAALLVFAEQFYYVCVGSKERREVSGSVIRSIIRNAIGLLFLVFVELCKVFRWVEQPRRLCMVISTCLFVSALQTW